MTLSELLPDHDFCPLLLQHRAYQLWAPERGSQVLPLVFFFFFFLMVCWPGRSPMATLHSPQNPQRLTLVVGLDKVKVSGLSTCEVSPSGAQSSLLTPGPAVVASEDRAQSPGGRLPRDAFTSQFLPPSRDHYSTRSKIDSINLTCRY